MTEIRTNPNFFSDAGKNRSQCERSGKIKTGISENLISFSAREEPSKRPANACSSRQTAITSEGEIFRYSVTPL
jgi:hypothetical protein